MGLASCEPGDPLFLVVWKAMGQELQAADGVLFQQKLRDRVLPMSFLGIYGSIQCQRTAAAPASFEDIVMCDAV